MNEKPRLDVARLPEHGADWGGGVVLRGTSRGEGVPIPVTNPRGPVPRRVVSGQGDMESRNGSLTITPSAATQGEPFFIVAEF